MNYRKVIYRVGNYRMATNDQMIWRDCNFLLAARMEDILLQIILPIFKLLTSLVA
jgi:hypothetical protein